MPPFTLTPLTAADSARLWTLDQRCFPPGIAYSEAEIRACLLQANRGFHAAIEVDGVPVDGAWRGHEQSGPALPSVETRPPSERCSQCEQARERPRQKVAEPPAAAQPPAAFILALLHWRRGHIITLDVAPEYRRQGMGLALMQAAEQHFRTMGAIGMRLETAVDNHAARRFYARLDYQEKRRLPDYYAPGQDGLLLLKDNLSGPACDN